MISPNQTNRLEEFINQGYKEKGRTKDEKCVILENDFQGIVYDIQRDKIIAEYKKEIYQRGLRR